MKVSEMRKRPPKLLIYSRAGLGKSALAMTLGPECMYIDLDDNMEVAFGLRDQFYDARQQVEVRQFLDNDPKKALAFMQAKKLAVAISNSCIKDTFEYKYLVVDSLTSLAAAAQTMVMANNSKLGSNPQIQHWGSILTEIYNFISLVRTLPIPVFILAHETTFTSDDENVVQISIPGQKLPGQITRMFSEIWYLRCKQKGAGVQELYIQTVPTSSITCRSGRGLPTGTRYATIAKDGSPVDSVGMKELLAMIDRKESEPTPVTTTQ